MSFLSVATAVNNSSHTIYYMVTLYTERDKKSYFPLENQPEVETMSPSGDKYISIPMKWMPVHL